MSYALNTAVAGLRLAQSQISIVSQNVANAGTVGYVRRTLDAKAIGPGNNGVATGTIARTLDAAALKQMRLETSGAAYTGVNSSVRTSLDALYGIPGDSTSLDGVINSFASSLQALAASPSSAAARSAVVQAATSLASQIGSIANGVQDLRSAMESQLAQDTADASGLLASIAKLNAKISLTPDDTGRADLLDQRDQAINSLSALMDVQTVARSDGSLSVLTNSGVTLVEGGEAAKLSFDSRGTLSPNASYSTHASERGVGTITATTPSGATIDLIADNAIRSGSMAAAIEARDSILPQAQRQLDDLAAALASAMSDKTVTGTASGSGIGIDLDGIQPGNTLTLAVKAPDGSVRNITLVASAGATTALDPNQTNDPNALAQTFDISGGPSTYAAAIQAALSGLSGRATAAGYPSVPLLSATGTGSAVTIAGASGWAVTAGSSEITVPDKASTTKTGTSEFALFVDAGAGNKLYTGSFDGGSQLTGFAQRIGINPAIRSDTSALVAMSTSTASGDTTRPQALYDALSSTNRTFSAASGIGGTDAPSSSTILGFAQGIIANQGAAAASAQSLDQGQAIALATAQSRFSSQAGVNIDEEMSKLIELQTAYTANARVLTAARDMLDTLLRI